jgi:hypothetical protein
MKYMRALQEKDVLTCFHNRFLVDAIMCLNVFGCPPSSLASQKENMSGKEENKKANHSSGIWTRASYINHCCTSTVQRAFIGDMMIIRANQDMDTGTEITFWYHSPINSNVTDLQKKLENWGFVCDCVICEDGRATKATIVQERKQLLRQAKRIFDAAGTTKTNKLERLLNAVEKLYAKPADEVPRTQLWDPFLALAQVFVKQGRPDKALEWITKGLKSLGFKITGLDSSTSAFLVLKWGLAVDALVVAFLYAKDAFRAIGIWEKSMQAEDYARLAYKIIVGEDSSFDAIYN